MSLLASHHLATGTPIRTLPFRCQAAIAPLLLIVTKAKALCDLRLVTSTHVAVVPPGRILTLRRQSAVSPDLLIVPRAVSRGASLAPALRGGADFKLVMHDVCLSRMLGGFQSPLQQSCPAKLLPQSVKKTTRTTNLQVIARQPLRIAT